LPNSCANRLTFEIFVYILVSQPTTYPKEERLI
jgi:hypothetical protein